VVVYLVGNHFITNTIEYAVKNFENRSIFGEYMWTKI